MGTFLNVKNVIFNYDFMFKLNENHILTFLK